MWFNSHGNLPHPGPIPACSDIEVIALTLFQSLLSIESECRFFSLLRFMLPELAVRLSSRRNYNSRRRRLTQFIEFIRKRLSQFLCANTGDGVLIIDSMPIETCRYSRSANSRILRVLLPRMAIALPNNNCTGDTSSIAFVLLPGLLFVMIWVPLTTTISSIWRTFRMKCLIAFLWVIRDIAATLWDLSFLNMPALNLPRRTEKMNCYNTPCRMITKESERE